MNYVIAKKNNGSARVYSSQARLATALKRRGALDVEFKPDGREVTVRWPENTVAYAIDKDGNVEEQLAWDL